MNAALVSVAAIPLGIIQGVRKPHLKLDLFAALRGRCRHQRYLVEGARELSDCLDHRKARQRSLPSFAPPFDSRVWHAGLGEVMGKQLRLDRSSTREIVAQGLADAAMQSQPPALEQVLISRVLNERVLEAVVSIWRKALD